MQNRLGARRGLDEDEFVLNIAVTDLAWLGFTAVIIKGDNEIVLQALIRKVIERRHGGRPDANSRFVPKPKAVL